MTAAAAYVLCSSVNFHHSSFASADLFDGNLSFLFDGRLGRKPVVMVIISENAGMWFQLGRGKHGSVTGVVIERSGGILLKKNGTVSIEFNVLIDHNDDSWQGIQAGLHASQSRFLIKLLKIYSTTKMGESKKDNILIHKFIKYFVI
jgi:hypothetical protein